MPSAGPDAQTRARFIADYDGLLEGCGRAIDAPVGVALSGGPDSTALLILARAGAGPVKAITVDHGLRAEAAAEAEAAAALCDRLGVPHETVRVTVGARSVQAAAREARYRAFADWSKREGLGAVLTAHHADDQSETVLMRLARGAGLAGLAGIRAAQGFPDGLLVLRPLLSWRKTELEAVCRAAGVGFATDPSNSDPRFDRTAARALLEATDWLDASRVAASAQHLAEAEAALAAIADERYSTGIDGNDILLRPDPLPEITRRHLRRLLAEQFDAHPDGPSLNWTMTVLATRGHTTCADVLCRADGPVWRFRRAPPRRSS